MMWLCERMSLESFRNKEQYSQLVQGDTMLKAENSTASEQMEECWIFMGVLFTVRQFC